MASVYAESPPWFRMTMYFLWTSSAGASDPESPPTLSASAEDTTDWGVGSGGSHAPRRHIATASGGRIRARRAHDRNMALQLSPLAMSARPARKVPREPER